MIKENAERERLNRLREQSEQSDDLSSDDSADTSSIDDEARKEEVRSINIFPKFYFHKLQNFLLFPYL